MGERSRGVEAAQLTLRQKKQYTLTRKNPPRQERPPSWCTDQSQEVPLQPAPFPPDQGYPQELPQRNQLFLAVQFHNSSMNASFDLVDCHSVGRIDNLHKCAETM